MDKITIEAHINAPIEKVWDAYNNPDDASTWNAASPDWHCPHARNDLIVGGTFSYRMEAKDGSAGFDFAGTYTKVVPHERIEYTMDDAREVAVVFTSEGDGTHIAVTFDPETENAPEMQKSGWQAILNNFKNYIEG